MQPNTYAKSTRMPCDDCKHRDFCIPHGKTCKVSRYWENYGRVLYVPTPPGKPRSGIPAERVPDRDIVIAKHRWNSK